MKLLSKFTEKVGMKLLSVTGRKGLMLQKNSPEIFLVIGIGGIIGAGVLACRATLKVEGVIDDHQGVINKINDTYDEVLEGEIPEEDYSEKDFKKDLAIAHGKMGIDFVKLYGPPIVLGAVSIGLIIKGHNIMKQRNIALAAAYKGLDEAFKAYRRRVVDEHGRETDYMYRHGLKKEQIEELEIDENGETKLVPKNIYCKVDGMPSQYSKYFDSSCEGMWSKNPDTNLMTLRTQQSYFNNLLNIRGHVFLNEVYDALAMKRTTAGCVVGWLIGDGRENFIDFGLYDNAEEEESRRFINGLEHTVLLDFNVDGPIHNLIGEELG